MAILNYTTKINADKTVAEIQAMLGQKGASRVSVDYGEGKPSAITFTLEMHKQMLRFRLPCNIGGVQSTLTKQRVQSSFRTRDHAARVAWRILKDWIAAQLALIEAGQAEFAEVFLPYLLDEHDNTAYQALTNKLSQLQLSAGEPA